MVSAAQELMAESGDSVGCPEFNTAGLKWKIPKKASTNSGASLRITVMSCSRPAARTPRMLMPVSTQVAVSAASAPAAGLVASEGMKVTR